MEILETILCIGFCIFIGCYIVFMVSYAIHDLIKCLKNNKSKD